MYEIDKLPKESLIEELTPDGYQVLLPDGTRKFVSIVPGEDWLSPIKVVKTIFPKDAEVTITVGEPFRRR